MPTVDIDGISIHYLVGANGLAPGRHTIIFVHGAGGNALVWQNQRRGLDRGVNTVCVDLPGHGQSEGSGCASIADYSKWLLRFLHSLELDKVTLAGHSMGGAIALDTAIQSSQHLKGLVLVGTGARLRVNPAFLGALQADFDSAAKHLMRQCYGPGSSEKLIRWSLEQLLRERPEIVLADFRACNQYDRIDQIDGVRHPTLVVSGNEDVMIPPKYSEYLAANLKRATLVNIEGAGHMVMVENPFKVNAAIVKFLATL